LKCKKKNCIKWPSTLCPHRLPSAVCRWFFIISLRRTIPRASQTISATFPGSYAHFGSSAANFLSTMRSSLLVLVPSSLRSNVQKFYVGSTWCTRVRQKFTSAHASRCIGLQVTIILSWPSNLVQLAPNVSLHTRRNPYFLMFRLPTHYSNSYLPILVPFTEGIF
jgi:hypothetical protein